MIVVLDSAGCDLQLTVHCSVDRRVFRFGAQSAKSVGNGSLCNVAVVVDKFGKHGH